MYDITFNETYELGNDIEVDWDSFVAPRGDMFDDAGNVLEMTQRGVIHKMLKYNRFGNFLKMSNGKMYTTAVTILTLLREGYIDNVLIIAPNIYEWKKNMLSYIVDKEFRDWLKILIITPSTRDRFYEFSSRHITLCTKESFRLFFKGRRYQNIFSGDRNALVYDEVHTIKSPSALISKAVLEYCGCFEFRYLLTGTVVPNGFEDMYVILKVLDSGLVPGTKTDFLKEIAFYEFSKRFKKDVVTSYKLDVINRIQEVVDCITVAGDLHGVEDVWGKFHYEEIGIDVGRDEYFYELYKKIAYRLFMHGTDKAIQYNLLSCFLHNPLLALSDDIKRDEKGNAVKRLGFKKYIEKIDYERKLIPEIKKFSLEESYKGKCIVRRLHTLLDGGHRVLLWSNHPSVANMYGKWLKKIMSCDVMVATSKPNKNDAEYKHNLVQEFNNNEGIKILCTTFGFLGTAVSVKGANFAIAVDLPTSYVNFTQATRRIYGFGRGVEGAGANLEVYYLSNTLEKSGVDLIRRKKSIDDIITKKCDEAEWRRFLLGEVREYV